MGLEPTPPCGDRILSPARLPFRHFGSLTSIQHRQRPRGLSTGSQDIPPKPAESRARSTSKKVAGDIETCATARADPQPTGGRFALAHNPGVAREQPVFFFRVPILTLIFSLVALLGEPHNLTGMILYGRAPYIHKLRRWNKFAGAAWRRWNSRLLAAARVILAGLWEVGRITEVQQVMWNSAREAARDASLGQDNLQTVAANLLTYLQGAEQTAFGTGHSTTMIAPVVTLPANTYGYTCWDNTANQELFTITFTDLTNTTVTDPTGMSQLDLYQIGVQVPYTSIELEPLVPDHGHDPALCDRGLGVDGRFTVPDRAGPAGPVARLPVREENDPW